MNKSTPDLPLHRARLRRALLASPQFEGSPFTFMKKLLPIGLALALLLTLNFVQKPDSTIQITPQASAQELLLQVSDQIHSLSTEEIGALEETLGFASYSDSPINDVLQEAQSASDLRDLVLTEETVVASDGKEYCIVLLDTLQAFASDQPGCIAYFEELRSVIFTDSDGSIVVMMVNDALFPAAIFSFHPIERSGEQSMTVFGSSSSPFVFSSEEEASHLVTFSFDRNLDLEENMVQMMEGLPSAFEQFDEETEDLSEHQSLSDNPATDCSSWTSEDGLMGGGGC